jgi:hypothetical protein
MNPRTFLSALTVILVFSCEFASHAEPDKKADVKLVMREKLESSQKVLVGIITENYGLITTNAEKLVELSHATNWYSRQVPEYELLINEFRRDAEALVKAGKQSNIDAASLAYVQMTLSCVTCHKYIRGAGKSANAASDSAILRLSEFSPPAPK